MGLGDPTPSLVPLCFLVYEVSEFPLLATHRHCHLSSPPEPKQWEHLILGWNLQTLANKSFVLEVSCLRYFVKATEGLLTHGI
jgi:hypothetical protein